MNFHCVDMLGIRNQEIQRQHVRHAEQGLHRFLCGATALQQDARDQVERDPGSGRRRIRHDGMKGDEEPGLVDPIVSPPRCAPHHPQGGQAISGAKPDQIPDPLDGLEIIIPPYPNPALRIPPGHRRTGERAGSKGGSANLLPEAHGIQPLGGGVAFVFFQQGRMPAAYESAACFGEFKIGSRGPPRRPPEGRAKAAQRLPHLPGGAGEIQKTIRRRQAHRVTVEARALPLGPP